MSGSSDRTGTRRFEGRVVLVAGTGPGVGRATAVRYALEGARVVCAARNEEHLDLVRETMEQVGVVSDRVRCLRADLATAEGAEAAVREACDGFGRLDVLAVTAGGFEPGGVDDPDTDRLERMLDVNLRAAWRTSLAAAEALAATKGAVCVTTAVFGACVPGPGVLAYNTAKAAATGFVRSLAADLRPRGVRVNGVLPGGVSHRYEPDRDPRGGRTLGVGPAWPEDVAAAVLFLTSDEAFWITGATLVVDGGFAVSRSLG